jgi:hypothetical protein
VGVTNLPLLLLQFLRLRRLRPSPPNAPGRHVIEAYRLRRKYGPAFDQIRDQFLGLDDARLADLLDAYGMAHGKGARRYAAATVDKWRGGQVTMAGQTMTRLFDLLPRVMTPDEKLALIQDLRTQTLSRLHLQAVRIRIQDQRDLVHVARQVLDMVSRVGDIPLPTDFVEIHGWISDGDAQALSGMARDMERFVAVQRLADLLIQLATVSRLGTLAGRGLTVKVQTHFEIPTATVEITLDRRFWQARRKQMADDPRGERQDLDESDQDFLVRLQDMALRQEHQDGSMTYIEYVMRTLTPEEQQKLRVLAATEGLRTEVLLQELRVKTIAARGDIDATIATAERLRQTGQNSKITSEHATASGTTRIEIENKKRPCYIATACYGDADHPDVAALRRFRDITLQRSAPGRVFITAYERLSPPLAARLGPQQWFGRAIRHGLLEPFVRRLTRCVNAPERVHSEQPCRPAQEQHEG